MKAEEIIQNIKKNKVLNRAEKKEMLDFWKSYDCPMEGHELVEARYHDGEVRTYTINELNYWYDETPKFIKDFFTSMSMNQPFTTRFAVYTRLQSPS